MQHDETDEETIDHNSTRKVAIAPERAARGDRGLMLHRDEYGDLDGGRASWRRRSGGRGTARSRHRGDR